MPLRCHGGAGDWGLWGGLLIFGVPAGVIVRAETRPFFFLEMSARRLPGEVLLLLY